MKFVVGVMLTSFGMFWGAEGAGASWPGGDAALLVIIPATLAVALVMVWTLRRQRPEGRGRLPVRPHARTAGEGTSTPV
jgi:uncharacterized membrane protein